MNIKFHDEDDSIRFLSTIKHFFISIMLFSFLCFGAHGFSSDDQTFSEPLKSS